jgi:hypothetical protein
MKRTRAKRQVRQLDPNLEDVLCDFHIMSELFDQMSPEERAEATAWLERLPPEQKEQWRALARFLKNLGER